jgi:hypothetical protein
MLPLHLAGKPIDIPLVVGELSDRGQYDDGVSEGPGWGSASIGSLYLKLVSKEQLTARNLQLEMAVGGAAMSELVYVTSEEFALNDVKYSFGIYWSDNGFMGFCDCHTCHTHGAHSRTHQNKKAAIDECVILLKKHHADRHLVKN